MTLDLQTYTNYSVTTIFYLISQTKTLSRKIRPPIPAKPQSPIVKMRTSSVINAGYQPSTPQHDSRAASEPPSDAPSAFPGGEMLSLPPQTNSDSPMPELLSLKDRLQLFEKVW